MLRLTVLILLLLSLTACRESSHPQQAKQSPPELVFIEHDGGADDLLAQLLVLTMNDKQVAGITVTDADCFIGPATESTYKLLQLLQKPGIEIGKSSSKAVHPFPNEWRARPQIANMLPMLLTIPDSPQSHSYKEGSQLLIQKLRAAPSDVSVLITGPCSDLVMAIKQEPGIKKKIRQVVWMGGAFRTSGNVYYDQQNGQPECNVYWDPQSSKELLEMDLPLTCIPLDVTNKVPVTKQFLTQLAAQSQFRLSNLAGQLWALSTDTIPGYSYTYYMWDVLAAGYLAIPGEFKTETIKASVSPTGQTIIDANGHEIRIATDVNKEAFYNYILTQFRRD